ncbi:hypothetical protein D3C80_1034710 [compost metagenome]
MQQGVVVTVVAHQHGADNVLAAGIDHQAPVAGVGLVDEAVALGPRRGAMGIADGAHVDPEQLELGGHVGAAEAGRWLTGQGAGDIAGHGVARRDQAENAAVPRGAFADGEDALIAAAAILVDHHPTARGDVQAAAAPERILRANAGGEHDQVGFEKLATVEVHAVAVVLTGDDGLGGPRQVHTDAQRLDLRAQGRAAIGVELHRHQPWRELHYMSFQPQGLERIGRLQPQQATAHYHATPCIAGRGTNGIEIVQGPVDQARLGFGAGNRRHKGIGAGGQDQPVIGIARQGCNHFTALAIDFQHRFAKVQAHAMQGIQLRIAQGQGFGIAAAEVFREVHPVVGTLAFLTKDLDLETGKGAALDQLLDTMMADHAVADDDQFFPVRDRHYRIHTGSSLKAIHGGLPGQPRKNEQKKAPGAEAPGAFAWY